MHGGLQEPQGGHCAWTTGSRKVWEAQLARRQWPGSVGIEGHGEGDGFTLEGGG